MKGILYHWSTNINRYEEERSINKQEHLPGRKHH